MAPTAAADALKQVEVDALVVLQIMKHCSQMRPQPVMGTLLGLDVEDKLQVTHCFGHPQPGGEDGELRHGEVRQQDDSEAYSFHMLRRLREVNVDSNTVGWYQTTHLGQFFSERIIEAQYQYQRQIDKCVVLMYDPLQAQIGKPSFKAFRLTEEFMKKHTEARESNRSALADFSSSDMFQEIPISIQSPAIVEAFLVDWAVSDPMGTTTQLEALDVENQAFLEKNVDLLIRSLQDLAEEQFKMTNFERNASRKGEDGKGKDGKGKGKFRNQGPPRPLDTMILSQQIQTYCKQINSYAGDSFGKLFLLSNKPVGVQAP